MILFPTIPEQKTRIGTPIVPRNKKDPTQSARQVSKMFNDIEGRYLDVKRRLKALFDVRMTGRERVDNCQQSWLMCNNEYADPTLYQVNAGTYIYDMTAAQLADLLQVVQTILDDSLLDGGVRICGRLIMSLLSISAELSPLIPILLCSHRHTQHRPACQRYYLQRHTRTR